MLKGPKIPDQLMDAARDRGILPQLYPLPAWEIARARRHLPRVRARRPQHRATCSPRPACRTRSASCSGSRSRAGPTSASRTAARAPARASPCRCINITKTRLNDPLTWFLGTNDQPGDYRSLGLRVVPRRLRERSRSAALRAVREVRPRGHDADRRPDDHARPSRAIRSRTTFTRSIPTSQCMICHMHQPNMFVNSFLGYTMWDYESDAPRMWPQKQQYPDRGEDPRGARPQSGRRGDARQVGATWTSSSRCPSSTRR